MALCTKLSTMISERPSFLKSQTKINTLLSSKKVLVMVSPHSSTWSKKPIYRPYPESNCVHVPQEVPSKFSSHNFARDHLGTFQHIKKQTVILGTIWKQKFPNNFHGVMFHLCCNCSTEFAHFHSPFWASLYRPRVLPLLNVGFHLEMKTRPHPAIFFSKSNLWFSPHCSIIWKASSLTCHSYET